MSVKHHYTILCDYILQPEKGKSAFVGIFTNIALKEMPGKSGPFFIAIGFYAEPGDEYAISIRDPKGKRYPVNTGTIDVDYSGRISEHQVYVGTSNIRVNNFPFEMEGVYSVELRQGKRVVHSRPFGVFHDPDRQSGTNESDEAKDE